MRIPALTEETKIPLRWVFGLLGCAATVLMVTGGLVAWGARLESRVETKVAKEEYSSDISQVKSDLRLIKNRLKIILS